MATVTLAESLLAALGSMRAGGREAIAVLRRLLQRVRPTLTRKMGA